MILTLVALFCTSSVVQAQRIAVEAFAGEPFGVGRVAVRLAENAYPPLLGPSGLALTEANGRVLYPVVDTPEVGAALLDGVKGVLDQSRAPEGRWLRELLDGVPPPPATVYFLFRGSEPLRLTLQARRASTFTVTPRSNPGAYRGLLSHWWHEYTTRPQLLELFQSPDYPPQVETYLKSTLARRLRLPLPAGPLQRPLQEPIEPELGLFLGTESMRMALERDRVLGRTALGETADQPLPKPIEVAELGLPDPPEDVQIEPLATRVPAECFYVRFGSFSNFLWFQDTLGKWRYDLQNLVALRGLNFEVQRRIEESLVMEMSVLARLLGETAVADVAIIGTDLAFQEGGAYGLLYHARNNLMLTAEFTRQRQERLQQGDGATDQKVTIGDREVSFLSSPDGSARSYYVADGDFHFVTRSKTLMKRFLETGSGEGSLGASKEFRYARSVMPLDRSDTVFVYVSDAFLENLVSPTYRIETVRRMQAMADVELVELALLASAAEGKPGDTIEQLVAGGFLPSDFGARPDGSRAVLENGEVHDSVRGRRGAFLPAPDVDVQAVSPSEADDYAQFGEFYHRRWRRLDPILVGVKRHELEHNRERVVIDARITPFDKENYARLREELGPAEPTRLAPLTDDGVAFEAVLAKQRIFGGLREIHPPSADWIDYGLWRGIRDWFVGYLGTTGEPGVLSPLNARIEGPVDERGYASAPGGMWRRDYDQFTLFSLQPDVLAMVAPQLRFDQAERPAQIRFRIEDVTRAVIYPRLNDFAYARTRETCLGNLRLMHDLGQQLHVPGEDCKNAAELLLGGELICPLGGEYAFQPIPGGPGQWTATAVDESSPGGMLTAKAPEGFVAPPLNWFRGLEAELTATPEALSIHAEVVMEEAVGSTQ
jgi:hypothetical protein